MEARVLSADQLIDASNGIYIPYTGIPENPQEARKLWSEESGINFTMPGKLSENDTNPQASRSSSSMKTGEALEYQTASTMSSSQEKLHHPQSRPSRRQQSPLRRR